MKKDKYPIKFKGDKVRLKLPVYSKKKGFWMCAYLNKDGTTEYQGFAGHDTEESCWVCCRAHNKRVGYDPKAVKKFIKTYYEVKKEEKIKKEKKANKRKSKSKKRKKK